VAWEFYLKSGRLDPNLLFEVEMLGLLCVCIVSAMLPKIQYLREHIYQVLFSLLVHHYYKVAILSVVTLFVRLG